MGGQDRRIGAVPFFLGDELENVRADVENAARRAVVNNNAQEAVTWV